jgi:predicted nuclease with TOPRIM domain
MLFLILNVYRLDLFDKTVKKNDSLLYENDVTLRGDLEQMQTKLKQLETAHSRMELNIETNELDSQFENSMDANDASSSDDENASSLPPSVLETSGTPITSAEDNSLHNRNSIIDVSEENSLMIRDIQDEVKALTTKTALLFENL